MLDIDSPCPGSLPSTPAGLRHHVVVPGCGHPAAKGYCRSAQHNSCMHVPLAGPDWGLCSRDPAHKAAQAVHSTMDWIGQPCYLKGLQQLGSFGTFHSMHTFGSKAVCVMETFSEKPALLLYCVSKPVRAQQEESRAAVGSSVRAISATDAIPCPHACRRRLRRPLAAPCRERPLACTAYWPVTVRATPQRVMAPPRAAARRTAQIWMLMAPAGETCWNSICTVWCTGSMCQALTQVTALLCCGQLTQILWMP